MTTTLLLPAALDRAKQTQTDMAIKPCARTALVDLAARITLVSILLDINREKMGLKPVLSGSTEVEDDLIAMSTVVDTVPDVDVRIAGIVPGFPTSSNQGAPVDPPFTNAADMLWYAIWFHQKSAATLLRLEKRPAPGESSQTEHTVSALAWLCEIDSGTLQRTLFQATSFAHPKDLSKSLSK